MTLVTSDAVMYGTVGVWPKRNRPELGRAGAMNGGAHGEAGRGQLQDGARGRAIWE